MPSSDIRECFDEDMIQQKLDYIHTDSIKGKWMLAENYLDYPHSSAGFFERGDVSRPRLNIINWHCAHDTRKNTGRRSDAYRTPMRRTGAYRPCGSKKGSVPQSHSHGDGPHGVQHCRLGTGTASLPGTWDRSGIHRTKLVQSPELLARRSQKPRRSGGLRGAPLTTGNEQLTTNLQITSRTPPSSATRYGNRSLGEPMNMKLVGIFHSSLSWCTSAGPNSPCSSMNSISISG